MQNTKKLQILKTLVGSRAHGTASEDADYDYRGVYIESSKQLLTMGYKSKGVSWVEGETEDQTSYELENFLNLAMKGHPNILEMFVAPVIEQTEDGVKLLNLFKDIWTPQAAFDAFNNYANNRKKHMINDETPKKVAIKSAYCYLRVLYNLLDLLRDKTFSIKIQKGHIKCLLEDVKKGLYSYGQVIDLGEGIRENCLFELEKCDQVQDYTLIHDFYLDMRKKHWE